MPNPPRYSLFRRVLFPYSGEEPLTFSQGLRVILAWVLLVPLTMSLFTFFVCQLSSFSLPRTGSLVAIAFLSGAFIFGIMGLVVVVINNRAARLYQDYQARKQQSVESGGRHGS